MADFNRRAFFASVSVAAALTAVPAKAFAATSPKTFVLVHGAWHGGWCWDEVADLLRAQGHIVFTPTLTGLGERSHLLSDTINLDTHITDIQQVLKYEDLSDVILVGHSYAGIVITGVANADQSRLGRLVYLDAILVDPGQAMADLGDQMEEVTAAAEGGGVPPMLTIADLGITDPQMASFVQERLDPQPLHTMTQALDFDPAVLARLLRTYIQTSEAFAQEAEKARAERSYDMLEIAGAGHDVMLTQPQALADMLADLS